MSLPVVAPPRWLLLVLALVVAMPLVADARNGEVAEALRQSLDNAAPPPSQAPLNWAQLQSFYAGRQYRPVWITHRRANYHADILRNALRQAEAEGLEPEAYRLAAIERLWSTDDTNRLASLELLLTDAFMRYSLQARYGRLNPSEVDPDWHIKPESKQSAPLAWLGLDADDFAIALKTLPPQHDGYRRLREALAHYRQIRHDGGWPTLPSGPVFKIGAYDKRIGLLRLRLLAEGDLQTNAFENLNSFDLHMKNAVKRFQARHGIEPDGVVGPSTREAMNVPVERRIDQIKLNLERWRWLPRQLGKRYVMVNTAGYTLDVKEGERTALSMRVITGQKDKTTPVLAARLTAVQLNPYWVVPTQIAAEELLPQQQKNNNYFASLGYRVFNHWGDNAKELNMSKIKWWKYNKDNFPYKVRQDPGPHNALGRMKFIFQNNFAIYLHDTPQRRLFDRENRALSHGCVRVEQPMQLALNLLQDKPGWDRETVDDTLDSGATVNVGLAQPVPIYLVYWTAWVGDNGQVNFREDVYERDRLMQEKAAN